MSDEESGQIKEEPKEDEPIKQEPIDEEQNGVSNNTPLDDIDPDKDEEEDGFIMPQHFLSTSITEADDDKQVPNTPVGSMEGIDPTLKDQDLGQYYAKRFLAMASGIQESKSIGSSGDSRYTLIHIVEAGVRRNLYLCNTCDEEFKDKRIVIRHVRGHVWAEKPLKCNQCEMAFDKQWMLAKHLKTHAKTRDFVCKLCGKAFFKEIHLNKHHNEKHSNVNRVEDKKDGLAEDALYLKKHFSGGAKEGEPELKEENKDNELGNGAGNADKGDIFPEGHFLSQSKNDSDEEGQDVNSVVGAKAENLWTVSYDYSSGRRKVTYSCNVCEKGFKDKRICIRHIRVHTGEKPFTCYLCGRPFGREDYLRRHIESHLGQKLFTCPLCNKEFMRKDSLEDHLLTHQDMSDRPYQCDQCDKGFIKKRNLQRHMKTHSEIKEFTCEYCSKGFNEKRNLLDHQNRRHNPNKETPKCKICDREFWSEHHYKLHMEAHEKEEEDTEEQFITNQPLFVSKDEREKSIKQKSKKRKIGESSEEGDLIGTVHAWKKVKVTPNFRKAHFDNIEKMINSDSDNDEGDNDEDDEDNEVESESEKEESTPTDKIQAQNSAHSTNNEPQTIEKLRSVYPTHRETSAPDTVQDSNMSYSSNHDFKRPDASQARELGYSANQQPNPTDTVHPVGLTYPPKQQFEPSDTNQGRHFGYPTDQQFLPTNTDQARDLGYSINQQFKPPDSVQSRDLPYSINQHPKPADPAQASNFAYPPYKEFATLNTVHSRNPAYPPNHNIRAPEPPVQGRHFEYPPVPTSGLTTPIGQALNLAYSTNYELPPPVDPHQAAGDIAYSGNREFSAPSIAQAINLAYSTPDAIDYSLAYNRNEEQLSSWNSQQY